MTTQVTKKDAEGKKKEAQVQKKAAEKNMSEIDEHILRRFEIKKRLGKGAYGIVWKAVDKKSKDIVAIKKIFDAFRNQTDAQRTFREILFLQSFRNHPNIVKLHSIHRASNNKDIYLGFEYMETDLHNVIKRGNILKDVHKRYIMYQMLKATKYIHSGNVIHRDQKPSNVLIDSACRVKIADFGLARSVSSLNGGNEDGADPCLTDYVATRWYRAPEILIASKRYTKGIDMWSLGCILGEMLIGKPLFPGSSTVNQIERIMSALPRPSGEDIAAVCTGYGSSLIKEGAAAAGAGRSLATQLTSLPRDAADLVQRLLVFNPVHRLSAGDALLHDYVARFHRDKDEPILSTDVVLPFRDDRQLSVDEYRNKLYSLMAKGMHAAVGSRRIRTSKTSSHSNSAICKAHGDTLEQVTHLLHKTQSVGKYTSANDEKVRINRNSVTGEKFNSSVDGACLNNTQSETKIKSTNAKNVINTPENAKSEHQINNSRKQSINREKKSLDSKLTSGRIEAAVDGKRRASMDNWLMYQEKPSGKGDFFQPVTRHSQNEGGYLSGGCSKKKTALILKGKRNSSSYSTISITNAGEIMGSNFSNFNQKHGIITASALMDLRSSIRIMVKKISFAFNLFFHLIYLTYQGNVQYQQQKETNYSFIIPSTRILMAVCKLPEDKYLCPHCSLYNNIEECELFSSSCRESEIQKNQYSDYCDKKYGQWRTKFIPANYSICQCCNDCVFYREIGESCVHNSNFNSYVSETLPVITEDLRAGCNPYKELPNEASKALECDEKSDTCVLMNSLNTKKDETKDVNPDCEQSTESTYMLEVKSGLPYKTQVAEPCKLEMRKFTKQFGTDGQSHFNAPQCTTLWKYRPVQCRGLRCYCALQDGTPLLGFDVPRADVSNMNCACAREKCETNNDLLECDGYGNYKKFCFVYLKEDHPPSQGNHVPLLRIEKLEDEIVYTLGVTRGLAHQTFIVTKAVNSSLITKTDDVNFLPLKTDSRLSTTEASPSECPLDETTSTKFSVLHYQMRNNAVLLPQLKFFFDDDEPLYFV